MSDPARLDDRPVPTVVLLSGGRHFAASFARDARARLGDQTRLVVVSWGPADEDLSSAGVSAHHILGPRRQASPSGDPSRSAVPNHDPSPLDLASLPRTDLRRLRHGLHWRYGRVRLATRKVRARAKTRAVARARGATKVYDWAGHRFWRALRKDDAARAEALRCDLLVALDGTTIRAAWQVARDDPRKDVVLGIPAAREAVARWGAASDS